MQVGLVGWTGLIGRALIKGNEFKYVKIGRYNQSDIVYNAGRGEEDKVIKELVIKGLDRIVWLASSGSIRQLEEKGEDYWDQNVVSPVRLNKLAESEGIGFLYLSTNAVFGNDADGRYEDSEIGPSCVYGRQKARVEERLLASSNSCILRLSKVVSGEVNLLKTWREAIDQGKRPGVWKDGRVAPISTNTVGRQIATLLSQSTTGIRHIGLDTDMSYGEFFRRLHPQQKMRDVAVETAFDPKHANLQTRYNGFISRLDNELCEIQTES